MFASQPASATGAARTKINTSRLHKRRRGGANKSKKKDNFQEVVRDAAVKHQSESESHENRGEKGRRLNQGEYLDGLQVWQEPELEPHAYGDEALSFPEFDEVRDVVRKFAQRVDTELEAHDDDVDLSAQEIDDQGSGKDEGHAESGTDDEYDEQTPVFLNQVDPPKRAKLDVSLSRRALRQQRERDSENNRKSRLTVSELKQMVKFPELVEPWDATAQDPLMLLQLKAVPYSVPVPEHWKSKKKYLHGKRGIEKKPYELPSYLLDTGLGEVRDAASKLQDSKSLKQKQREKVRPKHQVAGFVDPELLRNAFFNFQRESKPTLSVHGDIYYELREMDVHMDAVRDFRPGEISQDLREALGMGQNPLEPTPWLFAMQRHGPPPAYPRLKIPGVNAPVPAGAMLGFHNGGWGQPPPAFMMPQIGHEGNRMFNPLLPPPAVLERLQMSPERQASLWGRAARDLKLADERRQLSDADQGTQGRSNENSVVLVFDKEGTVTAGVPTVDTTVGTKLVNPEDSRGQLQNKDEPVPPALYRILQERRTSVGSEQLLGSSHVYQITPPADHDSVDRTGSGKTSRTLPEQARQTR
ncbi:Splicing factor 3B subunit 2 [Porphyridium purpureum]|uniref:Splicing factor 3B subunit 2 n=1 Tax=Porphyridium purpureum TaxID=35688 RepID=A0A5J4YXG0_PORPP|nr:Splicing factor 3B subunit 2 [Porphyridium purpureum]|eukprot:POR6003..scf209_3